MTTYYQDDHVTLLHGESLETLRTLPDESVNCCISSPPYFGARDYNCQGQIGLEETWPEYIAKLVAVFSEVRRVLRSDGTCWVNLGDMYATGAGKVGNCPGGGEQGERFKGYRGDHGPDPKAVTVGPKIQPNRMPQPGMKPKDLMLLPHRFAIACQEDGWWVRQDIVWDKPNCYPESVKDRCTKSHEYIFLMTKSESYWYDNEAIFEPLTTNESENYPARATTLGRGQQDFAAVRGNDRDNSGGFPPSYRGSSFNRGKSKEASEQTGAKVGDAPRIEAAGRNKRTVWRVPTACLPDAHFATFPEALIRPAVLAGCPPGGTILDPFSGAATTALVAKENGRKAIGIELNEEYLKISVRRLAQNVLAF